MIDITELRNELLPYGTYYNIENNVHPNYETEVEAERFLKVVIISNNNKFQSEIENRSKENLIERLNFHFHFYSKRTKELQHWFNKTKQIVCKTKNQNLIYTFDLWLTDKCKHNLPPLQSQTKIEPQTITPVIKINSENVQNVFDILKDFFSPEQQTELKQIIETGNKASKKLLFKDNGNRLTDTFKKLIEHDFITGCQKQDLINWVVNNFQYQYRNTVKNYTTNTAKKTISQKNNPCKNPLIEIKNNQILKTEQPKTKKR